MKLNIDLGYILKRLIVIGLGFILISQLKSCDVNAQSLNIAPSSCGTSNSNSFTNGSVSGNSSSVNIGSSFYYCNPSSTSNYKFVRFGVSLGSGLTSSSGTYSFLIYSYDVSNVFIITGGYQYSCELNTAVPEVSNSSDIFYSVTCSNVPFSSSRTLTIYIVKTGSNIVIPKISSNYVYVPNQDVASAVSDASSQAHQDSQATQDAIDDVNNAINDDDTTSASQNGNSIFDVDENGQSTNSNVSNYGLESVITAPIQILERATDSCSPLSFTIFQKTVTLPCGDALFWNRDFSSQSSIFSKGVSGNGLNSTRDTFRAFWNLFFGGAIIFHLLTILYEVCQKAIDPFDDTLYTISDAIDSRSRSSKLTGVEEVDMSDVQHNLNNYSIKKQASQQEAVVLGSVK